MLYNLGINQRPTSFVCHHTQRISSRGLQVTRPHRSHRCISIGDTHAQGFRHCSGHSDVQGTLPRLTFHGSGWHPPVRTGKSSFKGTICHPLIWNARPRVSPGQPMSTLCDVRCVFRSLLFDLFVGDNLVGGSGIHLGM